MINPTGYRILVKPNDIEEVMTRDFGDGKVFEIVGDKKLERSAQITGTVVAVGNQAWKAFGKDFTGEPWAKVGDKILFAQHAGRYVTDPETDEQFLLMNDEDVTAVITGES